MNYCFFNGEFVNPQEAKISIFDLAILRAWAVFDFGYARGDKVFYGAEHIERLANSAKIAAIKLPYSLEQISAFTEKLLQKNGEKESLIRWVLTGGVDESSSQANFAILNETYVAPEKKLYENGIKIETIELKREIPLAKTSNYQIRYSHLAQMKKEDIFELLYVVDRKILECTTANIFLVKNGVLYTPKDEILPGITRGIIIKLAREAGIRVIEKEILLSELLSAEEAFISNTTKKIMPVRQIDSHIFCPKIPTTKYLIERITDHEKRYFGE